MNLPAIRLVEVGPRDGLQNEKAVMPLVAKVAFVDALSAAGLKEIEAGAFVSPAAVPQMADSAEVFESIVRHEGVVYSALVPNEKGLDRALDADADKIAVFTAASETFNRRNINASVAESIERFKPVLERTLKMELPVRGYISTAFYCPFEGKVAPEKVLPVAQKLLDMGVEELSIGDTIGRAVPDDVRRLLELLLKSVPAEKIFLHFHDTYGMAAANALTAWREFSISGFDSSSGGLGGCPYAPGATGNVATEDLIFAFKASGARVPADLAKIQAAAKALEPKLGRGLASHLSKIDLTSVPPSSRP